MQVAATCKCDPQGIRTSDGCGKCGKPTEPPRVYQPPALDPAAVAERARAKAKRDRMTPEQRKRKAMQTRESRLRRNGTVIRCVSMHGRYGKHLFTRGSQHIYSTTCLRCGAPNTSKRVR